MATEIMGLLQRLKAKNKQLLAKSNKVCISYTLITPFHIRSARQKYCTVFMGMNSSPLALDPLYKNYFSANPRDQ
eukprot:1029142-Pelagomonas_calceolata.AAC.1